MSESVSIKLWKNESKNGTKYLSGKFYNFDEDKVAIVTRAAKEGWRVAMFPNKFKDEDGEKAADFVLKISEPLTQATTPPSGGDSGDVF